MATLHQIRDAINNANTLGRTNLAEKGITVDNTATTYQIMQKISEVSTGTEYTNIVYNEDNTVTLTDKDGIVHTMSCTYEDGKLTGVNYDGEAVELAYDGDVLVNVGKTAVDMGKAPSDGIDCAEAYDILSKESPVQDSEEGLLNLANILIGGDTK